MQIAISKDDGTYILYDNGKLVTALTTEVIGEKFIDEVKAETQTLINELELKLKAEQIVSQIIGE